MSDKLNEFGTTYWAKSLDDVDREIARYATMCNVRILDPGVIEPVLKNDDSVCGSRNPTAFTKMRTTPMMHYHVREQAAAKVGETQTALLVQSIVDKLRERIGERLGGGPAPTK